MRPMRRASGGRAEAVVDLAAAAALSLLLLMLLVAAAGAERREQECFCTGLWTCIARTGVPYSECDREGQRVICCVRRSPQPSGLSGPTAAPTMASSPTGPSTPGPTAASNEVEGRARGEDEDLDPDADTHFRYSMGRQLGVATTAAPLLGAPRSEASPRVGSTAAPPTTAFDEEEGEDDDDDDDDDDEEELLGTTPRTLTTTSRPLPRPKPSSSRPPARSIPVFVTPLPAARGSKEIEWEDGAPHTSWSEEEGGGRLAHPQQKQFHMQPQREPKKIDWNNLARPGPARPPQHSKPVPQGVSGSSANIAEPWSSWQECGRKGPDSGLDGTAEPSEWPWHAALLETASDRYVCGASLIGPTWLLTAAHCVLDYPDPSALKVRVGEYDVRSDSESFTQERAVVELVAHPTFDHASLQNDIALVRIARSPRDHRNVGAVCLPPPRPRSARQHDNRLKDDAEADDDFPQEGSVCFVTGWGRKDEMSPHSEVLKEVPVPLWSRGPCQEALRTHLGPSFLLPKTALCAGAKGRDACDGDGGGPLVCNSGGRWFQMGIVSYGIGCGRHHSPGVYTKLSSFTSWVRGVVGGLRSMDVSAPTGSGQQAHPQAAQPRTPAPRPAPKPTPRPTPRTLVHQRAGQPGQAVSRVRVNHYTGSPSSTTTASPPSTAARVPTRNVVVLSSEQDEVADRTSEEESDQEDDVTDREAQDVSTTTTATPTSSSTPTTPSTSFPTSTTQRSARVLTHSTAHRGAPSAGVSYFRSNFGSSGWSYPLEVHKAAATATSTQTVAPLPVQGQHEARAQEQAGKWYSAAYSGSYRGTAGGHRLPAQILSNVAGRTASGLNRWYSPFYSGSYRGDYNAFPKDELDAGESKSADTVLAVGRSSPAPFAPTLLSTTPASMARTAFNVRPPLAAPRWYAPLHDPSQRWYSNFHNGTYRTGYTSGQGTPSATFTASPKHRFATDGPTAPAIDQDRMWTYLVQTGADGTSITLDKKKGAEPVATAAHPPFVSDGDRQGRTLVNYTNTFTYPSAPHRNTSRPAAPRPTSTSLSSSYSIYHIYPSVYSPEYRARAGKGRESKAQETVGPAKTTVSSPAPSLAPTVSTAASPTTSPAASTSPSLPDSSHNSIVGYMHFNTGDTAVHFNITHDDNEDSSPAPTPKQASALPPVLQERMARGPAPAAPHDSMPDAVPENVPVVTTIAALDLTTLRVATVEDSTTGGEGMDMPPVAIVSTTEAETSAPTASPTGTPTESATTFSTDSTTWDMMTTTELDAIMGSRGRVRAHLQFGANDNDSSTEGNGGAEARVSSVSGVSRGSAPARSTNGGSPAAQDTLTSSRNEPEPRPEASIGALRGHGATGSPTGPDATWGDRSSAAAGGSRRGRTQQAARGGRWLDVHAAEADSMSSSTPGTPRPRSRGRSRPQQPQQPEAALSFAPRRPPTSPQARSSKDRAAFHSAQAQRHSKLVDNPVVDNPESDPSRAFRARGRRPGAVSQAPTPTHSPPPTPTASPPPSAAAPFEDTAHFVTEVKPVRGRGRDRKSEFRRRGPSATAGSPSSSPELEPEMVFGPISTAAPQRHSKQRNYAKKPRKQLKKVSLASIEEPVETVYAPVSPSPAPVAHHQHLSWFPAEVAAEAEVGQDNAEEQSGEHHVDGVEDLERDDVYSFLSQRNKRRRGKQTNPPEVSVEVAAEAPRWSRKGASVRRRGPAANEE